MRRHDAAQPIPVSSRVQHQEHATPPPSPSAPSNGRVAFVGFADFNGDGTTDMMLANPPITGAAAKYELYDVRNNTIVGAHAIGAVGQEWSVAGFGPISGPGDSDMVLHNRRTGAFEVYHIANDAVE